MSARWRSADGTATVEVITIRNGPPPRDGQRMPAPGDGLSFLVRKRGFITGHYRCHTGVQRAIGPGKYAELLDALGLA